MYPPNRNSAWRLRESVAGLVRFFCKTLLTIAWLPALVVPPDALAVQTARADYRFAGQGLFRDFEIYVTWDEVSPLPQSMGFYQMFAFWYQNGATGYMGTQFDGWKGKKAIFSVWDDGAAAVSAVPVSPHCKRFGHEGNGAQCIIPYDWVEGREYRLKVRMLGSEPGGVKWAAAIQDTLSGRETAIGVIQLRDSKGFGGYGLLKGDPATVTEYYGTAGACETLPFLKVTWRGPYADNRTETAEKATRYTKPSCVNNDVLGGARPVVVHVSGGTTYRRGLQKSLWPAVPSLDDDSRLAR